MKKIEIFSKWDFQPVETFTVGEKNVQQIITEIEDGIPIVTVRFENASTTQYVGFAHKLYTGSLTAGSLTMQPLNVITNDGKH